MDIPLLEVLLHKEPLTIYRIDGRTYPLLVTVDVGPRGVPQGRRHSSVPIARDPTVLRTLGSYLAHELGWLKQLARNPCFCLPGKAPVLAYDPQNAAAELQECCIFAIVERRTPINPQRANISLDSEHIDTATLARHIAEGTEGMTLLPVDYTKGFNALINSTIPDIAAAVPWPIVGQIKGIEACKFYWRPEPAEPAEPGRYPHLHRIFAHHDICPYSHYRLFQYLLGCFHTSYLNMAVPLLVIDSWEQAMGKTEIAEAVANLLHGERVPCISPGHRSDAATDQITSHYGNDYYLAVLDNLDGALNWNHDWLATQLTQRAAGYRIRYDRFNTNFRARAAILTLIYGRATLHEDMISRFWRVQIRGTVEKWYKQQPPFYSKDYALEHRDELISECYWAVKRGLEKNPLNLGEKHRARAFAAAGHAGYLEVFGEAPKVPDAHRLMLTTQALQLFKAEKVWFRREPLPTRIISPSEELYARLEGGEAMGLTVKGGKVEKTTP